MTFIEKSSRALGAGVISCILLFPSSALPKDREGVLAVVTPAVDIFNFGQVSPAYFRGAELKGSAAAGLAARGVKMVIDLRSDADVKAVEAGLVTDAGMKYVRIPMTTRLAPTSEQVARFLSLVTDPANQPVYVHCVEGRHRTGVMTAIYRMAVDGWTPAKAFDEMKDYKFGMDFLHPEFKKYVFDYRRAPSQGGETLATAGEKVATGETIATSESVTTGTAASDRPVTDKATITVAAVEATN